MLTLVVAAAGSNAFKYHTAKPGCGAECDASCWTCVPCIGLYFANYVLEKATVEDMILGGAKVTFDANLNKNAWYVSILFH